MTVTASLHSARRFLLAEARLLERRVFATLFEGADAGGALDALTGYRNEDGGYGHGLETDKRAPTSQPLDVETAFGVMDAVGRVDEKAVLGACEFLRGIGPGVGCLVESALEYPRAPHWQEWALAPSINPTAGVVARLVRWGIGHAWREGATAYVWAELEAGLPKDAHAMSEALLFLEAAPDRTRAEAVAKDVKAKLGALELFNADPSGTDYGLTPLHLAPTPDSRWLGLFDEDVVEANLDALARAQRDDGGWPISWETVGPAAVQESRGVETLRALRTLRAFGRLA